jgi:hypothetical protein
MTCSSCETLNELHRSYCCHCGARIRQNCPRCGFGNGLTDRFCGSCADALIPFSSESNQATQTQPGSPSISSDSPDVLSSKDLEELLHKPAAPVAAPLSARVSQNELDKLFGSPQ